MNTKICTPIVFALGLSLSACGMNSVMERPGDSQFGEANRQTMMAQVVNPEPVYDGPMTTSGEHAADAVERYRNDAVKDPVRVRTTNAGVGSGRGDD